MSMWAQSGFEVGYLGIWANKDGTTEGRVGLTLEPTFSSHGAHIYSKWWLLVKYLTELSLSPLKPIKESEILHLQYIS